MRQRRGRYARRRRLPVHLGDRSPSRIRRGCLLARRANTSGLDGRGQGPRCAAAGPAGPRAVTWSLFRLSRPDAGSATTHRGPFAARKQARQPMLLGWIAFTLHTPHQQPTMKPLGLAKHQRAFRREFLCIDFL